MPAFVVPAFVVPACAGWVEKTVRQVVEPDEWRGERMGEETSGESRERW